MGVKTQQPHSGITRWRPIAPLADFLRTEASSGAVIVLAAALGLILANSSVGPLVDDFWHQDLTIALGDFTLSMPLLEWVNSGLMTVFFLLVGLEIKREVTTGHLNSLGTALLPGIAAVGGMALPALLYLAIAPDYSHGWAIPVATDIALALGVVALFAPGLTQSVRAFLLALAVVDDIGAIIIIALFYGHGGHSWGLVLAGVSLVAVLLFRLLKVQGTHWYVLWGVLMWFGLHEGGIHATIAGVVMGLLAPTTPRITPDLVDAEELKDIRDANRALQSAELARSSVSVVEWLEHLLHKPVGFVIVPLFAFANTGIVITGDLLTAAVTGSLGLGIIVGLVVGKPVGIGISVWLSKKAGLPMPAGMNFVSVLTVGAAAGIGFTVSMFITGLALYEPEDVASARVSVLLASVTSAVIAGVVARWLKSSDTSEASDAPATA